MGEGVFCDLGAILGLFFGSLGELGEVDPDFFVQGVIVKPYLIQFRLHVTQERTAFLTLLTPSRDLNKCHCRTIYRESVEKSSLRKYLAPTRARATLQDHSDRRSEDLIGAPCGSTMS